MAVKVVVAGEDEAARVGDGQGCDAGVQAGVLVVDHLLVGAQVVHLAAAVVGACDDGVAAGEELEGGGERQGGVGFATAAGAVLSRVGLFVSLTAMALMSLVCPEKVCLQVPSLTSHSLASESQAPEMKVFMSGDRARDMQSPMWLVKITFCLPVSRSHRQLTGREGAWSSREPLLS